MKSYRNRMLAIATLALAAICASAGTANAQYRATGRFTLSLHGDPGWYANGSLAHTWRGDVTLDRPFYYTDGQLFFSDQVDMPNVFELADRIQIMRLGRRVAVVTPKSHTMPEAVAIMTGAISDLAETAAATTPH